MYDKIKQTRTKGSPCPYCGEILDGATSYEGHTPKPGSFSVCLTCASLLKFGKDLVLEKISNEELAELKSEAPEFIAKLEMMQQAVRQLDRRMPWEKPPDVR